MTGKPPALAITGLTKRFSGQLALDSVDLQLNSGEIRGVVGENGAGKSTLIKILAGIYDRDGGEILIDGRSVTHLRTDPSIAFVHQDLGLVDEVSIGESVALTAGFPVRGGIISWRQVWKRAEAAYDRMGLDAPDPQMRVGHLLPAEKALLGIVRALSTDAAIAVLDEPTASLPATDVSYLLDALRKLKAAGTAILYVTHRLQELFDVADSISVLRSGRLVADGPIGDFTIDRLVESMLGRPLEAIPTTDSSPVNGSSVFSVDNLTWRDGGPISFALKEGEVLGIVGLRGSGHEQIGQLISGVVQADSGEMRLGDEMIDPREPVAGRMARGIAALPADRQRESIFPGMTLVENLFPGRANSAAAGVFITPGKERERALRALTDYDVRPLNMDALIDQLSGGNQQKVCVARILDRTQKLVVLEEPTAGVDVGSKFEIHRFARNSAAAGTGVIIVSSDFEEVATLCTRVIVIVGGRIVGELEGADVTQERLIVLASGGSAADRTQPNFDQR